MLALGCHADDIELGCGGTLLRLKHGGPRLIESAGSCFSAQGARGQEARASAGELLDGVGRR